MFSRIERLLFLALALAGTFFLLILAPLPASANPCVGLSAADMDACEQAWQESVREREEVLIYQVQAGDSVWAIAARFGLDVDTLRFSNPELMRNPDLLAIDQELRILPFLGAIHTVKPGETLDSIAHRWDVTPSAIAFYGPNQVDEGVLSPGQELIIPGGYLALNIPAPALSPGTLFAWPLRGTLTQRYKPGHLAIDVATSYGATVYAAGDGVVINAGWLFTGYGYSVMLRHANGLVTLYSHLKGPLVAVGQRVSRGQAIGAVGSTGRSTGPHVHFEVRKNGVRVDPLPYSPPLPPR